MNSRRVGLASAIVAVVLIGWVGWEGLRSRSDRGLARDALAQAEHGEFARALPTLRKLANVREADLELVLALGVCAKAVGRVDEAIEAWRRIPRGTTSHAQAVSLLLGLARESGHWYAADGIDAQDVLGMDTRSSTAADDLLFLLRTQGRQDEARSLLQALCMRAYHPAEELRRLWSIDTDPFPAEGAREVLNRAQQLAPNDDRIWLGQAHASFQLANFDESRERLEACLKRRTDDVPLWRLKLALARACDNRENVRAALSNIPARELSVEWLLELRAWLLSDCDERTQYDAWKAVRQRAPAHPAALERLAELESALGRSEAAARWRALKAKRDIAQRQYEEMLMSEASQPDAEAMARLAEQLGRTADARAWWRLAARISPGKPSVLAALQKVEKLQSDSMFEQPRLRSLWIELTSDGPNCIEKQRTRAQESMPRIEPYDDVAARTGLDFRFENGATSQKQLPETMSGGVGLLDYDKDGWLDVYVVQGGRFPPLSGSLNHDRLYRNRGDGSFEDATERAGIAALPGGYGHGVAIGDVNNDGCADVLVTRWRGYALYLNQGDGHFCDATDEWGLGGERDWPTSAAFADLDGDGHLDLYVCHYVVWDANQPRLCRRPGSSELTYCPPAALASLPDRLFRNDGRRFQDVSQAAGITQADTNGRGLGVVAADLDGDGLIDLFVANDTTANFFFRNQGGMRFEEQALAAGLAANVEGGYLAGMGIACGDVNADGRLDLAVTNFYGECTTLYENRGKAQFDDRTQAAGLAALTRHRLGFGASFADMNNDGYLDLITANGHVDDYAPAYPYAMPAQLILGTARGRFLDATRSAGPGWTVPRVGRGLAVGDLDNDGFPDVLLIDQRGPIVYLHRRTPEAPDDTSNEAFVTIALEGTASNRDGVGAVVELEASNRRWVAWRTGGGSYQSAGDPRLHFGLGEAKVIDRLTVHWPSGQADVHVNLPVCEGYQLREGSNTHERLPGFDRGREAAR